MEILIVLVPVSLLLLAVAVWFLFWAADHGQFEDLDKAADSILHDEPVTDKAAESTPAGDEDEARNASN